MPDWVQDLLAGNRRALARVLTLVENRQADAEMARLYPHTGHAWVIGVTGAPGTGKSSLVTALAKAYRTQGKTVCIVAVDPTSPFSGGAILGDRIRMRDLSGDAGVFIRSMATRGSLGGLARTTRDMVRVMDAAGFDMVIVETVGAGQSEVDIVRIAYTTLVVEAPGMGDDVQAIKAGILEIADVLVVNKSDHAGANQTIRGLRAMLELGHPASHDTLLVHHGHPMPSMVPVSVENEAWLPPIVQTVATENKGIDELVRAIDDHRTYRTQAGIASSIEARYIESELVERLQTTLIQRFLETLQPKDLTGLIERVRTRQIDPNTAIQQLLAHTNIG